MEELRDKVIGGIKANNPFLLTEIEKFIDKTKLRLQTKSESGNSPLSHYRGAKCSCLLDDRLVIKRENG
ncbi:MAG: hypothetical protein KKE55_05730 [Candidatus Omnitrophica bacterium]|nr:hypothetical protein [Candidatus Omnitrophota bacterium]